MSKQTRPALLHPVVAHRGSSGSAPENTLSAFQLAANEGAQSVELDVMISLDGVAYVHHDDGLERCTNGKGYLCAQTAEALDKLSADNGMDAFKGEPLPRFERVMDFLISQELGLNVEIKPTPGLEIPTAKATCDLLRKKWPKSMPLVISSFSREALSYCKESLPDAARALIVCAVPDNWNEELRRLDARNIHCAGELVSAANVTAIKAENYGLYCFTVNDAESAQALWDLGVDGVFSDFPKRLLTMN